MADWSHPVLTDTYANFLSYLTARDIDAATMGLAGLPTNPPSFFIKADTTYKQLYYYDTVSSSYLPLFGGSWAINITGNATSVSAITSAQVTSALGFTPLSNAAGAVGSSNIATGAVTTSDLAANAVTAAKIALGTFTTVASAATVDLGAQSSRNIQITGTTAITSFGSTATGDNVPYVLEFVSALTISGSATQLLPGGIASGTLTINAGETILVVRDSATVWHIVAVFKPYGTSAGQAVALDSSGKLPAIDGSQLTGISASGRLLRAPQILTSGTSYTTLVNCNSVYLELIGGGGGGGGYNSNSGASSGGGGGGGYCATFVSVTPSTPYTIAIGAGGSGTGPSSSGTTGGTGGTTSTTIGGITYSASGGNGGPAGGNAGGTGGTGANGFAIGAGGTGTARTGTGVSDTGGYGAGSGYFNSLGLSSGAYGSGGRGGGYTNGTSGGNGIQGVIRVWEYS